LPLTILYVRGRIIKLRRIFVLGYFVDYGEESRFLIKILTTLVILLTCIIVILGFLTVKQKILYINPSVITGTARVGYIPDDYVSYFAMTFVFFRGNANPYSVLEQYKTAYQMMSPRLQSAEKSALEKEVDEIQKSQMSIQTTPVSDSVKYNGDEYIVSIKAIKVSWVYGKESSKEEINYTIVCKKSNIRKSNPFGMEVVSYDFKTRPIPDNYTVNTAGQQ